jgi:hypothetical protein
MSVNCYIFLDDALLPSVAEWQAELDKQQCGIVLEPIEDLRTHSGYLPTSYHGQPCGYEWYYGTAEEIFGKQPEIVDRRTHAIDFVTHSDMQELICGMISGAVLAKLANGLVLDEESGEFVDGNKALEIAKRIEAEQAEVAKKIKRKR